MFGAEGCLGHAQRFLSYQKCFGILALAIEGDNLLIQFLPARFLRGYRERYRDHNKKRGDGEGWLAGHGHVPSLEGSADEQRCPELVRAYSSVLQRSMRASDANGGRAG